MNDLNYLYAAVKKWAEAEGALHKAQVARDLAIFSIKSELLDVGKCRSCHGTGKFHGIGTSVTLASGMPYVNPATTCQYCLGTGMPNGEAVPVGNEHI